MATQTMINDGAHHFHSETVGADVTSDPVIITDVPDRALKAFAIIPTGTAKVQITVSPRKDIEADLAVWVDWNLGDVSEASVDGTEYPITGARLVTTGGAADWEIRA